MHGVVGRKGERDMPKRLRSGTLGVDERKQRMGVNIDIQTRCDASGEVQIGEPALLRSRRSRGEFAFSRTCQRATWKVRP